jgi:hypothetical protein
LNAYPILIAFKGEILAIKREGRYKERVQTKKVKPLSDKIVMASIFTGT